MSVEEPGPPWSEQQIRAALSSLTFGDDLVKADDLLAALRAAPPAQTCGHREHEDCDSLCRCHPGCRLPASASPAPLARYDQCDETCTVDCGHCKGTGPPGRVAATEPDTSA